MLSGGEHFVKEGVPEELSWEYFAYSEVQKKSDIPRLCEGFVQTYDRAFMKLRRIFCFSDIFKNPGTIFCIVHSHVYINLSAFR